MKNRNLSVLFILLMLCTISSCKKETPAQSKAYKIYQGKVFGTYYRIQMDSEYDFSTQIDSVFQAVNVASNVYDETSQLSIFNKTGTLSQPSPTLIEMLDLGKQYYEQTNHYFNPALSPIISKWGFGFQNAETINEEQVNKLLPITDYANVYQYNKENDELMATTKGVMLDLNGLAEGYTIDAITKLAEQQQVANYLIEIGGEMKAKGVNQTGKIWNVGVESPNNTTNKQGLEVITTLHLNNKAMSSSGSYRKFYTDEQGNKHPHIIHPKTGFPVRHQLLSVTLTSKKAINADALATACMAMGPELAKEFIATTNSIEGFLILNQNGEFVTWQSEGFANND